jgi:hypothetical protein
VSPNAYKLLFTGTACPAGLRGSRKATDTPKGGKEQKEKKKIATQGMAARPKRKKRQ